MTLTLPDASALTPAQVDTYATKIEQFASECEDITAARDVRSRWAAVTEYIRKSSRDGIARAEAAQRRIEQRIGELIIAEREAGRLADRGRPINAEGSAFSSEDIGIHRNDAAEFVAMAEHADVLDEVIDRSDDAAPATRNKVRNAIKQRKRSDWEAEVDRINQEGLRAAGLDGPPSEAALAHRRSIDVMSQINGGTRQILEARDALTLDEIVEAARHSITNQQTEQRAREAVEFLTVIIEILRKEQTS